MFERNRLVPGDFVIPIPAGIPIKLIYNSAGILSSIGKLDSLDMNMSDISVSGELLSPRMQDCIRSNNLVPMSIPIQGGTTIVLGVAVVSTSDMMKISGSYPDCIYHHIESNNVTVESVNAFYVMSYGANFAKMYSVILNWLHVCKFSVLKGFLVPYNDMDKFNELEEYAVSSCVHNIEIKVSMAYMIFDKNSLSMISNHLYSGTVISKPLEYINSNGVLMSKISLDSGEEYEVTFRDAKSYLINEGTSIFYSLYPHFHMILCKLHSKLFQRLINYDERRCAVCGGLMETNHPVVRCSDEHCLSREYKSYVHMMYTLCQPYVDFDVYIRKIKGLEALPSMIDLIDMTVSSDADSMNISLCTLINAAIPLSALGDRRLIDVFISLCRNKWGTVKYYLQRPDRLLVDFDLAETKLDIREFMECISNDHYVRIIEGLYEHPRICICETDKIYDVDPILRGSNICITGQFAVGNHDDVKGILRSYGAKVTDSIVDGTNTLIIGDLHTDVNGVMVNAAKKANILVVDESEFFKHHEIDKDIEDNLLLKHSGGQ